MSKKSGALASLLMPGLLSAVLYLLLYLYSPLILEWSGRGGWYFAIPIGIAFLFSIVHGTFTGRFWDVVGIKANPLKK